jgi:hypothetical protein
MYVSEGGPTTVAEAGGGVGDMRGWINGDDGGGARCRVIVGGYWGGGGGGDEKLRL